MIYHYSMNRIRPSPKSTATRSRSGRPRGTDSACARRSRRSLRFRSPKCGCTRISSALLTAVSPARKSSPSSSRWRGKPGGRCGWCATFSEAMVTCRRHAIKCKVKTGVKKDGTQRRNRRRILEIPAPMRRPVRQLPEGDAHAHSRADRYPNLKINSVLHLYPYRVSRVVRPDRRTADRGGDRVADGLHRAEAGTRSGAVAPEESGQQRRRDPAELQTAGCGSLQRAQTGDGQIGVGDAVFPKKVTAEESASAPPIRERRWRRRSQCTRSPMAAWCSCAAPLSRPRR